MRRPLLTNGFKSDSLGHNLCFSTCLGSRRKKCQLACKPGSVQPDPCEAQWDDHSSGTLVAKCFAQPTRVTGRKSPGAETPCHPYSVLLPVGFALPHTLPCGRCALTAPFHPCPASPKGFAGRFVFCGTFPGVAPAGRYPAPFFRGARTFLPCNLSVIAAAVIRPTGKPAVRRLPGEGQPNLQESISSLHLSVSFNTHYACIDLFPLEIAISVSATCAKVCALEF